jgi:hypothetical protein
MVVGDKRFGVGYIVCTSRGVWVYSRPENFLYFSTPRTEM